MGAASTLLRACLVVLAACGRIDFDALGVAGDGPAGVIDAPTGFATPALVANNQGGTGGASFSIAVTPIQAGDLVIAGVGTNAAMVTGVADNGGNAYVFASRATSGGFSTEIWFSANSKPGGTQVTVTLDAAIGGSVWTAEFSGVDPAAALDGHASLDNGTVMSPAPAPTVTTTLPNEVVFSVINSAGTVTTIANGNSFAALPLLVGDDSAYAIATPPGSYGAAWNMTGNGSLSAVTASFRPAPL